MTKRLCIVTDEFSDFGGFGAIGHNALGIAESSVDAGFAVDIILTSQDSDELTQCRQFKSNKDINIVPLASLFEEITADAADYSAPSVSYQIFRHILKQNYSSIHFQDRNGYGFYSALARRQGILDSFIITHLNGTKQWLREIDGGIVELPDLEQEAMERAQVASSDLVLTQSAAILSWYRAKGVDLPRCEFVAWPLPKWVQDNRRPISRQGDGAGAHRHEGRKLVFWGPQSEQYGFNVFLDTIISLPDEVSPEIWIIGPFTHIQYEFSGSRALRKLANYAGEVHFLPDISFKQAIWQICGMKEALCILPFREDRSPFDLAMLKAFDIPFVTCPERRMFSGRTLAGVGNIDESATIERLRHRISELSIAPNFSWSAEAENIEPFVHWKDVLSIVELSAQEKSLTSPQDQTPLVSVCLVHHDRPHFLALAINALMQQTYSNIEIVLVDDGSKTPEAIDYLEGLESSRHRFPIQIIRSENRYLGAARNLAASQANGEFLVFHDDDNISEKNQIDVFVQAAIKTNADILTCLNYSFASHDEILSGRRVISFFPTGTDSLYNFFSNRFGDANALFRKSIFFELGGFTEYRGVGWEDWELFLRASIRGKALSVIPLPLFNYRVSDDGMLASGNLAENFERIFAMLDEERPRFGSDILRVAHRDLLREEARKAQIAASRKEPFARLHQELINLQPNTQDAHEQLLELASNLGWTCTSRRIGPLPENSERQPQASSLFSFVIPPPGLSSLIVPNVNLVRGQRLLLFRGWSKSKDNRCVIPKGVRLNGQYYHRLAYSTQYRQDLVHLGLDQTQDKLGFVIACEKATPPPKRWFRPNFSPVSIPGQKSEAAVFLDTEKAEVLRIDELRDYCEASFQAPHDGWQGRVKIAAQVTSPLFYLDNHDVYQELIETDHNYRVFRIRLPVETRTVRLIIPDHQKIHVICE